jgi:DNA-binding NtrC family response regulator
METKVSRQEQMKTFIANSDASKKILNIAHMSSSLPVNVLISGPKGVGKKLLAKVVMPDVAKFDASVLEQSLINKTINIDEYKEIIVSNIDKIINKKEFMENLNGVKIVATAQQIPSEIESEFAIKIDIPPLEKRPEDLQKLIDMYIEEASSIYDLAVDIKDIDIDLSQNGISLKRSIYKNVLLRSLTKKDMMESLEDYFLKEFEFGKDYKDLLELFEIPLLNAAKIKYRSQVQMANNLNINRMTLRKKIDQYSNSGIK